MKYGRGPRYQGDLGSCSITGKVSYATRKRARRVASSYRDGSCHAYQCVHCTLWHIGHMNRTRNEYRVFQGMREGTSDDELG